MKDNSVCELGEAGWRRRGAVVGFLVTALVALGCGSNPTPLESPPDDSPRPSSAAAAISAPAAIQALYEPFTRDNPGDLVVVVFTPSSSEVVVVRGDEGAAELIYPLGSQAKLAVAMSLNELAGEGVVSLDQPIGELAAGIPDEAGSRTLRELLTHHGGLVLEPPSWEPPHGAYDTTALLSDLAATPPEGRRYAYSNLGYMLVAHVVEERLGRSFRDETAQRLSVWMSHRDGVLGYELLPEAGGRAALYGEDGEPPEETDEPYLRWSCCLLEGNVLGLASLGRFLLEMRSPHHRVLSPSRTVDRVGIRRDGILLPVRRGADVEPGGDAGRVLDARPRPA